MRALLALLALLVSVPATAQVSYPPPITQAEADTLKQGVQQQSLVQQTDVTLDAQGNGTWNFTPAFPIVPAVVHLPKAMDASNPIICNYTSISTTSVTVHCWRTNVSGLLSALLSGSIAGAQVKLIARAIP